MPNQGLTIALNRLFDLRTCAGNSGPTRFLTMAEVAEVEDGVVIIDCVAIVYEEGEGGEHYRNKNKLRCQVSRIEKRLVKLNEKIW